MGAVGKTAKVNVIQDEQQREGSSSKEQDGERISFEMKVHLRPE